MQHPRDELQFIWMVLSLFFGDVDKRINTFSLNILFASCRRQIGGVNVFSLGNSKPTPT